MNAKDDPHFGLMLAATVNGLAVGSYREMVVVSQTAEEYGFDSVWLCDHFLKISPGEYAKVAGIAADTGSATGTETGGAGQCAPSRSLPLLECWTALAALSRDTTKLRLGTSVLCNSYRHPSVLAKMAATLDVISQGRLDLGLGAGWFRRESQAYGIPFPPVGDRVSALAESLQVIKAVWTEPNPTYAGRFYTLDGATCDPPPVQRPHPPLWIGGEGDRVQRIAAKHAQGLNVRWWSPQQVTQRRGFLTQASEGVTPTRCDCRSRCCWHPPSPARKKSGSAKNSRPSPSRGSSSGHPTGVSSAFVNTRTAVSAIFSSRFHTS